MDKINNLNFTRLFSTECKRHIFHLDNVDKITYYDTNKIIVISKYNLEFTLVAKDLALVKLNVGDDRITLTYSELKSLNIIKITQDDVLWRRYVRRNY